MLFPNIPIELIHLILDYDGRIKYRNGQYVNIIHKHNERYNIIRPLINKKLIILKNIDFYEDGFYFEFSFDVYNQSGLCYDYHFSHVNKFEICYYNIRNDLEQIRTYL